MRPSIVMRRKASISCIASIWWTAIALHAQVQPEPTAAIDEPASIDFHRDIRPLLSDRCFTCHGFDAAARKAELRLDTLEGLTGSRQNGRTAVVPGDPLGSELWRRITSHDPEVLMPPPSSGLALDARERELLRAWIESGAPFERHWAFEPVREPSVPDVTDAPLAWRGNPIDAFVLDGLRELGLDPSARADPATLARRVSLDLLGLPPTPERLATIRTEPSDAHYERFVDELLASPHHAERLATMWLDVARYADTNGFHHDNVRSSWPYRDWVIEAFAQNMPFDRFVITQLAGDLLPDASDADRIATAFCRMHNINDEGGALDPEYRVEAIADRIETISTAFLGLTMNCCRCHDHKYDPFTQDDYYSLFAIFGSVDERGVYPHDFEQARAYPARLLHRDAELLARTTHKQHELDAARATRAAAAPSIQAELGDFEARLRERLGIEWVDARLLAATARSGVALDVQADGSVLAAGPSETDTHTFEFEVDDARDLRLLRFEALPDPSLGDARFSHTSHGNAVVTSLVCEVSPLQPAGAPAQRVTFDWSWATHEQRNGDFDVHNLFDDTEAGWAIDGHHDRAPRTALFHSSAPMWSGTGATRVRVTVGYESGYGQHVVGRPRLSFARVGAEPAAVLEAMPTITSDWWQAGPFAAADFDSAWSELHGPEAAPRIERDAKFGTVGWRHRPEFVDGVVQPLSGGNSAFYLARTFWTPVAREVTLALGSDDAVKVFRNGELLFENRVMRGAAPDQDRATVPLLAGENHVVIVVVNGGGPAGFCCEIVDVADAPGRLAPFALIPKAQRDAVSDERFAADWSRRNSKTYRSLDDAVRDLERALEALEAEAVPVSIMRELPEPKATFVLTRGQYDAPDDTRPVERRPPLELGGAFPAGAPHDRLGFAQWLVAPDNPLFARVHVNRIWQMLFGTGIVATAENFGVQAEWPSHPALLDWLARRFVDSGFDQRALIRLIVTSETYRQSSRRVAAADAVDPRNRRLAYYPRQRLAAEFVRDNALFAAGLLGDRVGGPSVKPYQPAGLWQEVSIGASSNTRMFERDTGGALYRRSMYTFWKRTSPSPQMTTFDAPTREYCLVRRGVTNTPLQALVLWNDEQFVEAARALAQRTLAAEDDDRARIASAFERCTGRLPSTDDVGVLLTLLADLRVRYRDADPDARKLLGYGEAKLPAAAEADPGEFAAWTLVASTLLGLDETIVKD